MIVCRGRQSACWRALSFACVQDAVNEQAAADVSSPFTGAEATTAEPITTSYCQASICPVNVHWHLGM